jgi:hypothetical protein
MKIEKDKVYIAVSSFVGDFVSVKRGMRLRGDNPVVVALPHEFVPDGASEDDMIHRERENEAAMEALRAKQNAIARDQRIAMGNKFDPSDDATAEAAKRAARSDDSLALVFSDSGHVIGVKTREEELRRRAKAGEDAVSRQAAASRAALAAMQAAREA